MNKGIRISQRHVIYVMFVYLLLAGVFFYAAYDKINFKNKELAVDEHDGYIQELSANTELVQNIGSQYDYIEYVYVEGATFSRLNSGMVVVRLLDKNGDIVKEKNYQMDKMEDNSKIYLNVNRNVTDKDLQLQIFSPDGKENASITVYSNSEANVFGDTYSINGIEHNGNIQMGIIGGVARPFAGLFWYIVVGLAILMLAVLEWTLYLSSNGRTNKLLTMLDVIIKYSFLIKQLVVRDFKTKYKRSVLGIFWSLLNPLMLMGVQYVLFSTFFRANIENYPVYLFGGSVLFSFFTDSVGAGLYAIVGNASLITKVYVPKYIYPISKVLSTAINLLLSMIPLVVALLVTHEAITKAYLLVPFVLVCVVMFCIGMSFILSASMVFFRDTQFIWGVLSMIWMYATPLFYPESILPGKIRSVLQLNPMYHYVKFFRTILMDGVSPNLSEYVWCLGMSLIVLEIGLLIYKKTQGKFALFV